MNQLRFTSNSYTLRTNPVSNWRGLSCNPALEVIYGPVFSGKTNVLIARLREATELGLGVKCVHFDSAAPRPNGRIGHVATHSDEDNSIVFPSIGIRSLDDLVHHSCLKDIDVLGIDDAHFFPRLADLVEGLATLGKRVIICGWSVDLDHRPFPEMAAAIVLADYPLKLASVCSSCRAWNSKIHYSGRNFVKTPELANAHFNIRTKLVEPMNVGDKRYEAICRSCLLQEDPDVFTTMANRSTKWRNPNADLRLVAKGREVTKAESLLMYSARDSSIVLPHM